MRLAARRRRDLDAGEETITNPEELARVRRQSRRVHAEALIFAVIATLAVLLLP